MIRFCFKRNRRKMGLALHRTAGALEPDDSTPHTAENGSAKPRDWPESRMMSTPGDESKVSRSRYVQS